MNYCQLVGVVRSAQGAVSDLITAMTALHVVIIYNDKQQSGRICRKLLFLLFAGQGKEFEVLQAILLKGYDFSLLT